LVRIQQKRRNCSLGRAAVLPEGENKASATGYGITLFLSP
jgi:hypothetical protein